MSSTNTQSSRCLFCGLSTLQFPRRKSRRRIYVLSSDFLTKHPYLLDYSKHVFNESKEISENDTICRPCVQRATRFVNSKKLRQKSDDTFNQENFQTNKPELSKLVQDDLRQLNDHDDTLRSTLHKEIVSNISLPVLKRCSSTAKKCIVNRCENKTFHRISKDIRINVLANQKLFISAATRVCREHLEDSSTWRKLSQNSRTHNSFNNTQIEDMIELMKMHNK